MLDARHEFFQRDLGRLNPLELGKQDLQSALKELNFALDAQEVPLIEGAELRLVGVPQPGGDRTRAVAQFNLQVEAARAVGAELLIRTM